MLSSRRDEVRCTTLWTQKPLGLPKMAVDVNGGVPVFSFETGNCASGLMRNDGNGLVFSKMARVVNGKY